MGLGLRAVFTLWLVMTVLFVTLRLLPSNALYARAVDTGLTQAQTNDLLAREGLDRPVLEQYLTYFADFLRGEWGNSLKNGQPVSLVVLPRLQNSLNIVGLSYIAAMVLAASLLTLCLRYPHNALQTILDSYITLSLSVPVYWTGTLALFFAYAIQQGDSRNPVLPLAVLSLHSAGTLLRVSQAELATIATQPYIAYARGKGISEGALWWRHQLPILVPRLLPLIGTQFVVLMGSTVSIEVVFGRAGLGTLLVDAVINRDYPVAQVTIGLLGIFSVGVLSLTSWLARWLNPIEERV
jgi:ABC-type dipeptide/oligopeptide/nickel transport system permease component